jgi:hypothetical protein
VCWVIINSDLLDRPVAFEDDIIPQMISEAFAATKPVKEGSSEYYIEDRLVVDAVKTFFLNHMPGEVEKAPIQFQAR